MDTIYHSINQLYEKAGYLARHGGDLYITIIAMLVVFLVVSYFSVMGRIKPLRANWVRERCKPEVIPYAGLVYAPPGKSAFEATADNFAQCGQTVTRNLAGYAVQPLKYLLNIITKLFLVILKAIEKIRALFNSLRNQTTDFIKNVMGRLMNIMIPLQQIIIAVKSTIEKVSGIGASVLYTIFGAYLSLKSLMGSIIEFIIAFLVMFTGAIIMLWIPVFTWPAAIAAMVVWAVIAGMLIYLIVEYSRVMKGSTRKKMPKKPKRP